MQSHWEKIDVESEEMDNLKWDGEKGKKWVDGERGEATFFKEIEEENRVLLGFIVWVCSLRCNIYFPVVIQPDRM